MDNAEILKELDKHIPQINKLGVSVIQIIHQLELFQRGGVYADVVKPCKKGNGIFVIDESRFADLLEIHKMAALSGRITKFVPASGAATRMFAKIQSYLNESAGIPFSKLKSDSFRNPVAKSVFEFITNLKSFAFYDELRSALIKETFWLEDIEDDSDISIILKILLDDKGLNYSKYPKGAILFHKYKNCARTAFEEHLFEAVNLGVDQLNEVKVHFTISEEHTDLFLKIINISVKEFEKNGIKIKADYSYQKKSTDTISVTPDNKLFRDSAGNLLFRPAGHGALIENLNEIDGDIILIKNIDNILPSTKNDLSVQYKKIMTGFLISVQKQVFYYLNLIENKKYDEKLIAEIVKFASEILTLSLAEDFNNLTTDSKADYLFSKLNRPLRVCGMVKNEGHPGGGPFFVRQSNSEISIQIVEESQINKDNPEYLKIFKESTHFNPVDMVCGVRDYKGRKFNLKNFVDETSVLISLKTYEGKTLKALELPGLWNGAMAYWNTVFIELPSETFNPVKEINDLLKPEHLV